MELIKKYKYLAFLTLTGFVFFVVYSWFNIKGAEKFTSPDETANYFFTELFAQKTDLRIFEPLNPIIGNIIQPRNTEISGDYIVPASFTGLMLFYGTIAKIASVDVVPYLTPFFSVIAVIFFYLFVKEFFSQKVSFTASLLMFFLPPFWYYTSRGLFHNVLFIDLLIIGLYFLLKALSRDWPLKQNWWFYFVSGIFASLAIAVRTSEITWVSVVVAVIFFAYRSCLNLKKIILILIPVLLVFIPILYYNHQLFGSYLTFGYSRSEFNSSADSLMTSHPLSQIPRLFFPFGLDVSRSSHYVYQYIFGVFPWFFILLLVAITGIVKNSILRFFNKYLPISGLELKKLTTPQAIYVGLYVFVSLWLIIYYGAYRFSEFYNSRQAVMGSSYLRYWLPIYIFGLPLCVLALFKLRQLTKNAILTKLIVPLVLVLIISQNVWWVLFEPNYGLLQIRKYVADGQSLASAVFKQTPSDGIIISGLADKLFFPERRVIVKTPDDEIEFKRSLQFVLNRFSVFYYYDPADQNSTKLKNSLSNDVFKLKLIAKFSLNNSVLYQVLFN